MGAAPFGHRLAIWPKNPIIDLNVQYIYTFSYIFRLNGQTGVAKKVPPGPMDLGRELFW